MTITTNRAQNKGGNDAAHPRTAKPVEALLSLAAGAALAGAGRLAPKLGGCSPGRKRRIPAVSGVRHFRRPCQGAVCELPLPDRPRARTHRMSLDRAPEAYETFPDKQDHCIKVVLDPWLDEKGVQGKGAAQELCGESLKALLNRKPREMRLL